MSNTEVTEPLVLDATGQDVVEQLADIAFILKTNSLIPATGLTFKQIQAIVRSGHAAEYFDIGDQIITAWSDGTAEYDFPWDVVGFGNVLHKGGATKPIMWLQAHYTLSIATQFDAPEAFLVASDAAIPAGTYNITMPAGYDEAYGGNKTYQFELQNSVPKDGCMRLSWPYQAAPSKVMTYASLSSITAIEEATLSEGSGGTSLGTIDGVNLNNIQVVRYGSNDWETAALRQYLNSDAAAGAWWIPQHPYDYICNYEDKQGFLAGLDPDFVEILGEPVMKTAKNYITGGGTSAEPVYSETADKIFLPSLRQHYFSSTLDEGEAWDYWKELSGQDSPVSTNATIAAFKTFAINDKTSAQPVWLRSANRGSAYYEWFVTSSGGAYSINYASGGRRCAPACCIS